MSGTAITSQKAAWLIGPAAKTRFEARPLASMSAQIVVDIEANAEPINARIALSKELRNERIGALPRIARHASACDDARHL